MSWCASEAWWLILLTSMVVCVVVSLSLALRRKLPPGPPALPIIGHLHLLGKNPHRSLCDLSKAYGPLMFLRFGSVPVIVASTPAMAKQILQTHDHAFTSRALTAGVDAIYGSCQGITFSDAGPYWKFLRQVCATDLFNARRMESFKPIRMEEVDALLRSVLADSINNRNLVSVRPLLQTATNNIISRMAVGQSSNVLHPVIEVMEALGAVNLGDFIPFLNWIDLQGCVRRSKIAGRKFNAAFQALIDGRREQRGGNYDPPADVLDILLLASLNCPQNIQITDDNIKAALLRRKPKSKAELEEGLHAKMTSDPHIDLNGSMEASKKGPDMLEEATNSPPLRQEIPRRRDKLPIQCGMHKSGSTLASAILVPSPDTISGYADMSIVSYHRRFVEVTTRGGSPTKTTRLDGQRLESEGHTQFRSIISKLVARVDMPMLYGIANNAQACTNVMNLFGMWMENTAQMDLVGRSYFLHSLWFGYVENQGDDTKVESLFSHIDASDLTWIFFPIVKLNHWCLFAWFNPTHKKLSKLHAKKTTLLYMGSLHGVIDPFQCMPSLHRALQALSKTCTNLALSPQLATPLLEVEFKCVRTPQQPNGHDCGYYVMGYCMHLLQAEALRRLDLNKWLTENWFSHQDVCNLRKDLHMWIRNTLDRA